MWGIGSWRCYHPCHPPPPHLHKTFNRTQGSFWGNKDYSYQFREASFITTSVGSWNLGEHIIFSDKKGNTKNYFSLSGKQTIFTKNSDFVLRVYWNLLKTLFPGHLDYHEKFSHINVLSDFPWSSVDHFWQFHALSYNEVNDAVALPKIRKRMEIERNGC